MSDGNGTMPSGLADILAGIDVLVEEQQQKVDQAKAVFDEASAELRKLRNVQRAARGPAEKPGPKPTARGQRMGEEELRLILERVAGEPDAVRDLPGSFTTRTLINMGMHKSSAERAIRYLRETEMIRLIGERVINGTRPSRVYVVNDVQS